MNTVNNISESIYVNNHAEIIDELNEDDSIQLRHDEIQMAITELMMKMEITNDEFISVTRHMNHHLNDIRQFIIEF